MGHVLDLQMLETPAGFADDQLAGSNCSCNCNSNCSCHCGGGASVLSVVLCE
jgi:hypothetical protein